LLDEARWRYERALVIQQQTLGRTHPMVAILLDRYSNVLREVGLTLEAQLIAGRAESIRTHRVISYTHTR
jgi:hypothetical protein